MASQWSRQRDQDAVHAVYCEIPTQARGPQVVPGSVRHARWNSTQPWRPPPGSAIAQWSIRCPTVFQGQQQTRFQGEGLVPEDLPPAIKGIGVRVVKYEKQRDRESRRWRRDRVNRAASEGRHVWVALPAARGRHIHVSRDGLGCR